MKYSVALVSLACVVALATMRAEAMPLQCTPGLVGEVPARIRKVCALLSTLQDLDSAMESYVSRKAAEGIPLLDNSVKRQDVDHVFLRFGRRR